MVNGKQRLDGMRIGVLAADGFEQVELTVPVSVLRHLGAEVEIISLRPGKIMGMNLMFPGKRVGVDRLVEEAVPSDYDGLLIPGGFVNPDFMRQSETALAFVREFDRMSKPIAFLCHAPMVLVSAGLVRGRRLTSWPSLQKDIENAGGTWLDEPLVRDVNWTSSRGPQDMARFLEGMVALFAEHVPAVRRAPRRPTARARPASALRWAAGAASVAVLLGAAGLAVAALRD